jgi:cell wall-associated NlpC family hydrolase
MKRPVISVAGGRGPAVLFACWFFVKYMYVKMGKRKIDSNTATWVVAGSAMFAIVK